MQKAVHLVDEQQRTVLLGFAEGAGDVLLGLADVHRQQVGRAAHQQRHVQLLGQPAAKGGLARARRAVQAQAGAARGRNALCQRGQVGVGVQKGGVIHLGQAVGVMARQRAVALGLQRVADQVLEGAGAGRAAHLGFDGVGYGAGAGDHGGGQVLGVGHAGQARGIQQVAAMRLHDARALAARRHGQLEHHVEAADEGGVHPGDGVGQPQRGHGVVLQHAVEPGLVRLGSSALQRAVVEHVFHLVKQQQRLALCQKALRGAEGAQAVDRTDRVAVIVLAGHLKQIAAQVLRQGARELGLARAGRAVHVQVDPAPLRALRVAQPGVHDVQRRLYVAVVGQRKMPRRGGLDLAAQQVDGVGVGGHHLVGEGVRQHLQLGLEAP